MLRTADDQPSVNALSRADPIVHYTIQFTVNRHVTDNWRFAKLV